MFEWKWRTRYTEDDGDDDDSDGDDDDDEGEKEEGGESMVIEGKPRKAMDERWRISSKHYFSHNAKVKCAAFHHDSNLLVVGFSSGIFSLYEMPDFNMIHTLRSDPLLWFRF